MKILSIALFILGWLGVYWLGKRAFNRRNEFGAKEFDSYGRAISTKIIEPIIKIASWLEIVLGFLFFCIAYAFHQ